MKIRCVDAKLVRFDRNEIFMHTRATFWRRCQGIRHSPNAFCVRVCVCAIWVCVRWIDIYAVSCRMVAAAVVDGKRQTDSASATHSLEPSLPHMDEWAIFGDGFIMAPATCLFCQCTMCLCRRSSSVSAYSTRACGTQYPSHRPHV